MGWLLACKTQSENVLTTYVEQITHQKKKKARSVFRSVKHINNNSGSEGFMILT